MPFRNSSDPQCPSWLAAGGEEAVLQERAFYGSMDSERVFKELDSNIVVPENSDATHEDILKVAMLLFLNYVDAATAMSETYGGGGGTGTGWGRDKNEDELEWARRCAMKANWLCKPIVRRWKRGK